MLLKIAGTHFHSANSIIKKDWKVRTNIGRLNIATHFCYLGLMKMQEVTSSESAISSSCKLGQGKDFGERDPWSFDLKQ
jgi:hypothetical protein